MNLFALTICNALLFHNVNIFKTKNLNFGLQKYRYAGKITEFYTFFVFSFQHRFLLVLPFPHLSTAFFENNEKVDSTCFAINFAKRKLKILTRL